MNKLVVFVSFLIFTSISSFAQTECEGALRHVAYVAELAGYNRGLKTQLESTQMLNLLNESAKSYADEQLKFLKDSQAGLDKSVSEAIVNFQKNCSSK